jgi:hypothetical protein
MPLVKKLSKQEKQIQPSVFPIKRLFTKSIAIFFLQNQNLHGDKINQDLHTCTHRSMKPTGKSRISKKQCDLAIKDSAQLIKITI